MLSQIQTFEVHAHTHTDTRFPDPVRIATSETVCDQKSKQCHMCQSNVSFFFGMCENKIIGKSALDTKRGKNWSMQLDVSVLCTVNR